MRASSKNIALMAALGVIVPVFSASPSFAQAAAQTAPRTARRPRRARHPDHTSGYISGHTSSRAKIQSAPHSGWKAQFERNLASHQRRGLGYPGP